MGSRATNENTNLLCFLFIVMHSSFSKVAVYNFISVDLEHGGL
jgi:hypothetical protein